MDKKKRLISIALTLVMLALFWAPVFGGREGMGMFNFSGGEMMRDRSSSFAGYEDFQPVTIYLATDTHYIAPSLTDGGKFYTEMIRNGDGKFMPYCQEINEAFVEKVIADKPDALIVAGDLTFNGAKESHVAFSELLGRVEDAGIPVLVIPGNHDLTVKRAARFVGDSYELVSSIDASEFIEIYGSYGREDSFAFDDTSLSYVYEVAPNLRILCVDVNTVAGMPGILTEGTLSFVKEQLQRAREDHAYVVGVTHQTLLIHSELTSQGMSFIGSDKLLELYEEYGVVMNLSGHMHIQHIAVSDGGVADVATGSLMTSPNYYGVIKFEGRKVSYEAAPFEVPEIEGFGEKAREFLWENAYRQGMEAIEEAEADGSSNGSEALSSGDKEAMARFFADFNVAYIAGRSDSIEWDEEILKKWEKTGSFVPYYFRLVQEEGENNYSFLDIEL